MNEEKLDGFLILFQFQRWNNRAYSPGEKVGESVAPRDLRAVVLSPGLSHLEYICVTGIVKFSGQINCTENVFIHHKIKENSHAKRVFI